MKQVKVKVCGITNTNDARVAESLGADFIGLVFVPSSPRCVDVAQAASIVGALKRARPIGVFVDTEPDRIESTAARVGLYAVQIYDVPGRPLTGVKCIRAIRVKDRESLSALTAGGADYFLLDSHTQSSMGGTGIAFDWSLLPGDLSRVFLSGGLNPENAREASRLGPFALDVCSGLEGRPGLKDEEKMRRFFAEVMR